MSAAVATLLVLAGAAFALVAAVGMLRMPDLPMRMHAGTKAGTLGAGLLLLAPAVASGEMSVVIRSAAAIVFLCMTAPVAAHMIGRAAYRSGEMRLWEGTLVDEWRQHGRDAREAARGGPAAAPRGAGPDG